MSLTARELFATQYVSYSRISSYKQCPRRFKLEYLDGYPCPVGAAGQLGTLVHAVIARHLISIKDANDSIPANPATLAKLIPQVKKELIRKGEMTERVLSSDMTELLGGFTQLFTIFPLGSIVGVEIPMECSLQGYKLKCVIDLVVGKKDGSRTIIDFKTGNPKYVNDLQLQTYALAYSTNGWMGGLKASYAFLRTPRFRDVPVDRGSCAQAESLLINAVQQIEADAVLSPQKSRLCDYCGVRGVCMKEGERMKRVAFVTPRYVATEPGGLAGIASLGRSKDQPVASGRKTRNGNWGCLVWIVIIGVVLLYNLLK